MKNVMEMAMAEELERFAIRTDYTGPMIATFFPAASRKEVMKAVNKIRRTSQGKGKEEA